MINTSLDLVLYRMRAYSFFGFGRRNVITIVSGDRIMVSDWL